MFFSLSLKSHTNDKDITSATEFTPVPKRKKEAVTSQFRQIIEMKEEHAPLPRRKKDQSRQPEEVKNEAKSAESKKDELIVMEVINSIRNKLTKCWHVPESIAYKEKLSIKINLLLSEQGEIIMADVADTNSYKGDPLFRSIADSAMRAVYKCSPLADLSSDYYHIWREITLDFILN
jgi:hypothetical protein